MDEGRGELNLEEGVQVLPTRRGDLAAPEEEKRNTTPGGDTGGGPVGSVDRVSREPLSKHRGTWATFKKLKEKYKCP